MQMDPPLPPFGACPGMPEAGDWFVWPRDNRLLGPHEFSIPIPEAGSNNRLLTESGRGEPLQECKEPESNTRPRFYGGGHCFAQLFVAFANQLDSVPRISRCMQVYALEFSEKCL